MKHSQFRALVFSGDEHITQELTRRIRKSLEGVPITLDFESNTRRVVSEFKEKLHDLVILVPGASDQDTPRLILQLQSVSGSARLLYLGINSLPQGFESVDRIELPIVRWDALMDLISACVPEHLAARCRLSRVKSPARQALEEYAKRYRESPTEKATHSNQEGCLLAPLGLLQSNQNARAEGPSGGRTSPSIATSEPTSTSTDAIRVVWDERVHKRTRRWEVAILCSLVGVTIASHWMSGQSDNWLNLKSLFTLLSAFAFFGFFAGRALEKFAISSTLRLDAQKEGETTASPSQH